MKNIVHLVLFLLSFWVLFSLLQDKNVYKNTLGLISKNWVNDNGVIKLVKEPFQQVNNENYIRWDGVHYNNIRKNGYSVEKNQGDLTFAFFPLFPLLWKILGSPPLGMLFINYLLFAISILFLQKIFTSKKYLVSNNPNILILISFPSLIVFLIPYTEALFLLSITIGLYGLVKKKYWIYFIGFLLASLSRPTFIFLFLSIICTEVFFFLRYKQLYLTLKNIFLKSAPLILGTFLVYIIQSFYDGGNSLKFITAQKHWDRAFSIPVTLRDWSLESFSINVGVLFLLFIPLLIILIRLLSHQINFIVKKPLEHLINTTSYLQVLSVFYLIGMFLFVLFFQKGSLNGLYRYTLCSPFLFVLLFSSINLLERIALIYRFLIFVLLSLLSILALDSLNYSDGIWSFSDLGLFLLISALFFWLFQDLSNYLSYKIGLYANVFINVIWTTYLFNTYIAGAWIFV